MNLGIEAAKQAVGELSNAASSPDHFEDFQREAGAEMADRGAAILLATNVENALENAIARLLNITPGKGELFGFNAPIGSFANKIIIGQAIGIYGPETRQNLDIIRVIRNAFAHAKRPIRFGDEELYTLCTFLIVHEKRTFGAETKEHKPKRDTQIIHPARMKFRDVCEITSRNLLFQNFADPEGVSVNALTVSLPYENCEIWAREKPLP
jgi:hypothetical protein